MNSDFSKSMQTASDSELIKILTTDRGDYQEVAILAAETELASRNLTVEQVESVKSDNAVQQKIKDEKANAPLDFHWKVLAAVFPGIFQLIITGLLLGEGYDRKAKELTKWTIIGMGGYVILLSFIVISGG